MPDPVTAHGWTVTEVHAAPGLRILHDNGSVPDVVDSARVRNERAARRQAKLDLARCIEDAATLAQARELAATLHRGENIFTGQVDDIHRLLTLLTGDGTDG